MDGYLTKCLNPLSLHGNRDDSPISDWDDLELSEDCEEHDDTEDDADELWYLWERW